MAMIRDAVADLFEPEKDSLRLSVEQTAAVFVSLMFTRSLLGGARPDEPDATDPAAATWSTLTPAEVVEVFLHGALAGPPHDREEDREEEG